MRLGTSPRGGSIPGNSPISCFNFSLSMFSSSLYTSSRFGLGNFAYLNRTRPVASTPQKRDESG